MNKTVFEKILALVCYGLNEKIIEASNEDVLAAPISLRLRQGLSMLGMEAIRVFSDDKIAEYLEKINITEFIEQMAVFPVASWFNDWPDNSYNDITNSLLFQCGSLVELIGNNQYILTDDCREIIDSFESDILPAIDEKNVFKLLKNLSQEDYVAVRRFLIEKPLINASIKKNFILSNTHIKENIVRILDSAYESIPENSFECPECGWTVNIVDHRRFCSSVNCRKSEKQPRQCDNFSHRVKLGIMRYICTPGKLELSIYKYCMDIQKNNQCDLKCQLWPESDRFDLLIVMGKEKWGIDAKAVRNPYLLAQKISNDQPFQTADFEKGFYVVSDELVKEYPHYIEICNKVLTSKERFKCVKESTLRKLIREKVYGK